MTKQIYLALAIHNHQPVGNFPWVFEQAYHDAYLPMLELLEKHPGIRLSLHYTGPLLDWLRANQPDFIPRIASLVKRGQVEMMGGGYYEPILPSTPDADKMGQLQMMSRAVAQEFGYRVKGMWLAERVWEPHLPRFVAQAGIHWTVVDDTHFKMVGLKDEDLFGYYVTEEEGLTLKIFGTSKRLRYLIPWGTVEGVISYLQGEADESGSRVAVMGDDGEKFGSWPGTYAHCWQEGWMAEFFARVEENSDWLHLIPLGDYAERFPAIGRIYLPTASYAEMLEWALPAQESYEFARLFHRLEEEKKTEITRFMRGGFWRHYLVKYPEINNMHKKMLLVSAKAHQAWEKSASSSENARLAERALDELWQGQCNCPYWHGVFGGIYMTDIRAATYQHLIASEALADRVAKGDRPWASWQVTDFDRDSLDEILLETNTMNLYFDPAEGGGLLEWDFRPRPFNLTSTLARRPEAYHQTLIEWEAKQRESSDTKDTRVKTIHEIVQAKEKGLDRYLHYDWHRRLSLLDHFLPSTATLEEFYASKYQELGDFINQPYVHAIQQVGDELRLTLRREGHLWVDSERQPLSIEKVISIEADSGRFQVLYQLHNPGSQAIGVVFGVEMSFNLLGGGGNSAAFYQVPGRELEDQHLDSKGGLDGVSEIRLGNQHLGLLLEAAWSQSAGLWRFPIETISNSEAGFERVYQGSCLLPHWHLSLAPGQTWRTQITLSVSPL
ncbi:MAG: DUF1926 domain-containing protein [Chloroflexi bacterium]|nr:DUF1926 domain-containing protein [Chloroflexota bacterium]